MLSGETNGGQHLSVLRPKKVFGLGLWVSWSTGVKIRVFGHQQGAPCSGLVFDTELVRDEANRNMQTPDISVIGLWLGRKPIYCECIGQKFKFRRTPANLRLPLGNGQRVAMTIAPKSQVLFCLQSSFLVPYLFHTSSTKS